MWTTIVGLVFLYGVIASTQDYSRFYVDEEPINGSETTACHLATPAITQYKWGDFHVNLTHLPVIDQHTYHRVSYVKTFGVFDYIGCANITGTSGIQANRSGMPRDVGLCYSFCNKEYFGISISTCFCFTSKPLLNGPFGCGVSCDDNATLCGANGSISIYKTVPTDVLHNTTLTDGKNCSLYNGSVNSAVWVYCNQTYKGLCLGSNGTREFQPPSVAPWSTYVIKCLHNEVLPTSDVDHHYNMSFWLGRIKTSIVKRLKGDDRDSFVQVENGYITFNNSKGGSRLSFPKASSARRKRLCVNVSESTTTITTTTTTTTTTTLSAADTSSTTLVSSSFADTSDITTQSTDKATQSARRKSSESASFIGSVYFYIIVGGSALILILLVGIICCCIRRKRRQSSVHIEPKHSDTTQERGPAGEDETYDVCDTPLTSGSGAPRDTPHDPEYDTTSTLATGVGRSQTQRDDADSSNVYNTTQDFSNDIYDHAGENKDNHVVLRDNIYNTLAMEDLYDHTSSDKSKQEFIGGNVYSTSSTVCKGKGGDADDTYDNAKGVATQTGGKHHDEGGIATQQGGT